MAKAPAVIEHIPSHLVQYQKEGFNQRFEVPAGAPIGRVSIEGKQWKLLYGGEAETLKSTQGHPMPFFDVCIVSANEGTSKTYWINGWERGSTDKPDCASIMGDVPDPGVPHPQSKTCAACKWNKFGTAENGKGKRCGDGKRIAVLPGFDFRNEDWGGPMLLRIPPTTFKDFAAYVKEQSRAGRDLNLIITRMRFDPEAVHPKLLFTFQRWITEDEAQDMQYWLESEHIDRVLMVTHRELAEDGAESEEDAEQEQASPAPARAQQAKDTSAREKMEAARAAQASTNKTAAKPAAKAEPKPAGKKTIVLDDEGGDEVAAPVKSKPAATPVARPAPKPAAMPAKKAKPVAVPEPEPEAEAEDGFDLEAARVELAALLEKIDKTPASSPIYSRLLTRAENLNDQIEAANGDPVATDEDGDVIEGEVAEDEEGEEGDDVHASASELLSALDEEDISGVPD